MATISVKVEGSVDDLFDVRTFKSELSRMLTVIADDSAKDFEFSAGNWSEENKPEVTVERAKDMGSSMVSSARAEGEVYEMLNWGTDPHPITSKSGGFLQFRDGRGFSAKTQPGSFYQNPGRNTGSYIRKQKVDHPGTEPRRWDVTILTKYAGKVEEIAVYAINQATKGK